MQKFSPSSKAMEVRRSMERRSIHNPSLAKLGADGCDAHAGEAVATEKVPAAAVVYHSRRPSAHQGCSSRESSMAGTDSEPDSSLEPPVCRGSLSNGMTSRGSLRPSMIQSHAPAESTRPSRQQQKRTSISDSEMPDQAPGREESCDSDRYGHQRLSREIGGILQSGGSSGSKRPSNAGADGTDPRALRKSVSFSDSENEEQWYSPSLGGTFSKQQEGPKKKSSSGIYRRKQPSVSKGVGHGVQRKTPPHTQDELQNDAGDVDGVFLMPRGLPNQGAMSMPKGKVVRPVSPERSFSDQRAQGEQVRPAPARELERSFALFNAISFPEATEESHAPRCASPLSVQEVVEAADVPGVVRCASPEGAKARAPEDDMFSDVASALRRLSTPVLRGDELEDNKAEQRVTKCSSMPVDRYREVDGVFLMPRGLPKHGAIAMPKGKVVRPVSPERSFSGQRAGNEQRKPSAPARDLERSFALFAKVWSADKPDSPLSSKN